MIFAMCAHTCDKAGQYFLYRWLIFSRLTSKWNSEVLLDSGNTNLRVRNTYCLYFVQETVRYLSSLKIKRLSFHKNWVQGSIPLGLGLLIWHASGSIPQMSSENSGFLYELPLDAFSSQRGELCEWLQAFASKQNKTKPANILRKAQWWSDIRPWIPLL